MILDNINSYEAMLGHLLGRSPHLMVLRWRLRLHWMAETVGDSVLLRHVMLGGYPLRGPFLLL